MTNIEQLCTEIEAIFADVEKTLKEIREMLK